MRVFCWQKFCYSRHPRKAAKACAHLLNFCQCTALLHPLYPQGIDWNWLRHSGWWDHSSWQPGRSMHIFVHIFCCLACFFCLTGYVICLAQRNGSEDKVQLWVWMHSSSTRKLCCEKQALLLNLCIYKCGWIVIIIFTYAFPPSFAFVHTFGIVVS